MEKEWEYNGCIIPLDLYYEIETQTWVRLNEDGTVTMGLTDVGQVWAGGRCPWISLRWESLP